MLPVKMVQGSDAEESRDRISAPASLVPLLPEDFVDNESVIPGGGFGFPLAWSPGMPGIELVQLKLRPEGPHDLVRHAIVAQVSHGHQVGDDPLRELPVVERQRLQENQVGDFADLLPATQSEKRQEGFGELVGGIDAAVREDESFGGIDRRLHVGGRDGGPEELERGIVKHGGIDVAGRQCRVPRLPP